MIKGISYGALAGAVWGGVFLVPRMLHQFSPMALMTGRYVAYGLVSLLLLLPTLRAVWPRLQRHDWITLLWLSVSGNLVYYLCLSVAVQSVGVAPTSLVIGMLPVLVTLVGAFEHNAIHIKRLILPLLAIVAGVACTSYDVFSAELGSGLAQDASGKTIGMLAAAGALVAWSAYTIGNARHLARRPDLSSHDWSLLTGVVTGAMALLLALPLLWSPAATNPALPWGLFAGLMALLAIGPSVIGTGLWNAATRRLPLTLGGQMIIFETVFALLYGFVWEARWPRPLELTAIVLLLGGVAASSWAHATHTPSPEHAG
ncbi:Permease of the drug/metabolite transporter (DMT) superfamily [Andreprevotia lacus DSM 23236]|jgi:drug/metabolite transporter (DMT)-like permease|uniref:Permease of the drug/metabolite transporter (DMT) superfamily n=1 Tax=Andreprevotia lacus DSM 23236 TaxID=1121001 RepID=A0A1W1WXH0_9NEIS|nr:DMT family transporter [Andreprevotia lacus]SMC16334.1 Permease of the drug/metabolite transporter (DMT) superfamily [Andreprevotia lacus DSM 23236]